MPVESHVFCSAQIAAVRREPDHRSERVTEALYWDELVVHQETEDWLEVSLPSQCDYRGWIPRASVLEGERPGGSPAVVVSPVAPLSELGDEPGPCTAMLWMGTTVYLNGVHGAFRIAVGPRGERRLISDNLVRPLEVVVSGPGGSRSASAAQAALSLHQVPYLWGGMSFRGVDCSGLIQIAFRAVGLILPRDADLQFAVGSEVAREDLRAGDAAFLEHDGQITHVMMMIDSVQVVHAYGKPGRVTLGSLEEEGIREHIAGFRRYL